MVMLQEIGEEILGDIINQKEDHLDKSELIKQTLMLNSVADFEEVSYMVVRRPHSSGRGHKEP